MFDGVGVESVTEQFVTMPKVLHLTSDQPGLNVPDIHKCGTKHRCGRIHNNECVLADTQGKHNQRRYSKTRDAYVAQGCVHKRCHKRRGHQNMQERYQTARWYPETLIESGINEDCAARRRA